jgi:hypothetical protein
MPPTQGFKWLNDGSTITKNGLKRHFFEEDHNGLFFNKIIEFSHLEHGLTKLKKRFFFSVFLYAINFSRNDLLRMKRVCEGVGSLVAYVLVFPDCVFCRMRIFAAADVSF